MNWLRVSVFCLIASAPLGWAQGTAPAWDCDIDKEAFVIMTSGDPLPDTDAIVVLWKRDETYQEYDSHGDGNWYYFEDINILSAFDHHSQIPPPRDDQPTLLGVLEGGIHELGLGQCPKDSDRRVHILRKGNMVYLMDEDLLHIVDMSNHVIASIDYQMGIYCSPGGKRVGEYSTQYLEECFDLYDVSNSTDVRFRMIEEPERFELGISQHTNADSDTDETPTPLEFEVHADWGERSIYHGPWLKLEDDADPGPYKLMGIALFKRQLLFDYGSGTHVTNRIVNLSDEEAPSNRAVLIVLSSLLASDQGLNVHLVANYYGAWPDLAWNLSNIHIEEQKQ